MHQVNAGDLEEKSVQRIYAQHRSQNEDYFLIQVYVSTIPITNIVNPMTNKPQHVMGGAKINTNINCIILSATNPS